MKSRRLSSMLVVLVVLLTSEVSIARGGGFGGVHDGGLSGGHGGGIGCCFHGGGFQGGGCGGVFRGD